MLVALAIALGGSAVAEPLILTGGGKTVEVEVAEVGPVFMPGRPSLHLLLTDRSGAAMADLTGAMIGERLTVSLFEKDLLQAVVRERLEGRAIINMTTIEAAVAVAVAKVMRGGAGCDTLSVHFPD